jgi:hypothetical protein
MKARLIALCILMIGFEPWRYFTMIGNTRIPRLFFAVLVFALSFTLMGANVYPGMDHTDEHELEAKLSGKAEVPGPGDVDGKGKAKITLKMEDHQVCWEIKVKKITLPAAAAHIHVGAKGVAGPVVVTLSAPNAKGIASGCTTVSHELHMNLHMHPELYYVNVHNSDFPGGAVRGQLSMDMDD